MKFIWFGMDLFADVLESLLKDGHRLAGAFTYETDGVFEHNGRVLSACRERNIPVQTTKPTISDINRTLDAHPDAIGISAGYIYRIPVTEKLRCVNIHPALLPVGRGPWPFPCTILRGLTESGVTLHKVAEGFDTGDIILREAYPVAPDETLDTLTLKAQRAAVRLTRRLMGDFDGLWAAAKPQTGGEYWPEPSDSERTVYPDTPPEQSELIRRAFGSYGIIEK